MDIHQGVDDNPGPSGESTREAKKGRRGKGSKSKQAEIFRAKKNRDFDEQLTKKIENIKISFGYASKDLFGDRMLTSIIRPQIKIPVNLSNVGALTTLVADVLHFACKIPPPHEAGEDAIVAFDCETLMWVTALQLEAKIYFARAGTQYSHTDLELCDRVRRTALLLPRAITPLAVFIDQIGKFILNEQMFIPVPNDHDDFLYFRLFDATNPARAYFPCFMQHDVQPGVRTELTDHHGRRLLAVADPNQAQALRTAQIIDAEGNFNNAFLQNPANFQYLGLVNFVPERNPPAPLTFTDIVRRYSELEGRVSKKLVNVFVEVELTKGMGVESQIVFRQVHDDGTCTAWSPRQLRADAFEMGAILGLGYQCPIGSRDCAANLCTIELTAGLENLANIVTKKLR